MASQARRPNPVDDGKSWMTGLGTEPDRLTSPVRDSPPEPHLAGELYDASLVWMKREGI